MENAKMIISKEEEKNNLLMKFLGFDFIIINISFNYIYSDYNKLSGKIFMIINSIIIACIIFKYSYYLFYKSTNKKESKIIEILNYNVKYNSVNKKEKYFSYINNILSPMIIVKNEQIYCMNDEAMNFINLDENTKLYKINIYNYLPEKFSNQHLLKNSYMKKIYNGCAKVFYKNEKIILADNKTAYVDLCIFPLQLNEEEFICISIKDNTLTMENENLQQEIKKVKVINKEIYEFFTNISHDLKTPINVIYSAIQVMNMNLNNKKTDFLQKYIHIIKQNCYRLLRLVNNIVDTNKIEAGCYKMKFKNNNIVSLVEDIVTSVATYVENNDMDIIFDTDIEEKVIACDKDMLERVILNLISNSVKYKKVGKGNIKVTVKDEIDKVIVSVKDNGIGIPKDLQPNVFNRFVQINKDEQKLTNCSSGIGLALVKSIITMHEGSIYLISDENKGTEMIIEIPVKLVKEEYKDNEINNRSLEEKIKMEFLDMYGHVI